MLIAISILILDVEFYLIYDKLFLLKNNGFLKNLIIFGADMSLSMHSGNKKKYILVLGKGITLDDASLTTETEYSINFTEHEKMFCLGLHYNGSNGYLFATAGKIYYFKEKDSELFVYQLFLRNISKKLSIKNMKETGLNEFSVDYSDIFVNNIINIHKYLMKYIYIYIYMYVYICICIYIYIYIYNNV